MSQLCRVCGEPAAGFHFGAFTCEGCKSFFGRTYNNLGSISECKNQGACVINKKNRTSCKACRLRKCLLVGMSKSGSRYGRRSNWFKIHCLLQEQQHQQQQHHQQQQQQQQHHHPGPAASPTDKNPKSVESARIGKPEDGHFGGSPFPAMLWPGRPPLSSLPPPPPHLPLPFLGGASPFLPAFNGGPPLFAMPPRPEWSSAAAAAVASRLSVAPPPSTPSPASSLSPPGSPSSPRRAYPSTATLVPSLAGGAGLHRRPPSTPSPPPLALPPRLAEQEQPMDLSRTAAVRPAPRLPPMEAALEPTRADQVRDVQRVEDKDEGSDSGVSERDSDRVGDGDGVRDTLVAATSPAVGPSPLDLSSRV